MSDLLFSVITGESLRESFLTRVTLTNLQFQMNVSACVAYVSEGPISLFILALGVDAQTKTKKKSGFRC